VGEGGGVYLVGEFDGGERELWWPDNEIVGGGGGIGERGRRRKKERKKERRGERKGPPWHGATIVRALQNTKGASDPSA
jgi:hypothetical protein